jgi:putative DNA primase/helicase
MGSIDLTACARSELHIGLDPDNDNKRVLVPVKSSLAPFGVAQCFVIEDGQFRWDGISDVTAGDMNSPEASREERSCLEDAKAFLRECLLGTPKEARAVESEAKTAGIAWRTVQRTKAALGVMSEKQGSRWVWVLPQGCQP